ncbi:MAG: hypothetical protein II711_00675, partial [Clostridia bacterium]|nr:hypothetical protein [Clostridia bacterium]
DVFVSIESDEEVASYVKINHSLAAGYVAAMKELCNTYELKDDISVSTISRYSDILTVRKAPENEEQLINIVRTAGTAAIRDFLAMREREGEKLTMDVLEHIDNILSVVSYIEEQSPKTVEAYRSKLYERLKEILQDTAIDEQRILTEAAI